MSPTGAEMVTVKNLVGDTAAAVNETPDTSSNQLPSLLQGTCGALISCDYGPRSRSIF